MVPQQIWRESLKKCMEALDQPKMCQISIDGPSVNWKFFNNVTKKREKDKLPTLINIGSCGLHVIMELLKLAWKLQIRILKKTVWCILYFA